MVPMMNNTNVLVKVTPKFGASKITLIKLVRMISTLSLRDAKDLVESLWSFQYDAIAWMPAQSVVVDAQPPVVFKVNAVRLTEFLLNADWTTARDQYHMEMVQLPDVVSLV